MKKSLLSLLAMLLFVLPASSQELAPGLTQETFAKIEPMVDKALAAYNANNWKAFYADFAQMMSGIATELSFNSLYKDRYKKQFGNYKSRKFNPAKSSVPAMNGVLVYDGVFDKSGTVEIGINIFQEDGVWKLQQVQFNPKI